MNVFWEELTFGLPEYRQLAQVIIRITASAILGAIIGFQREKTGKPAGLRTHILVAMGTTVFVLGCANSGMSSDGLSRIIQGIITGIGFIGAGSILKLNNERNIIGLTTAAGIWTTAAVGVTVGLGELGLAIIATVLTLIILSFAGSVESRIGKPDKTDDGEIEN